MAAQVFGDDQRRQVVADSQRGADGQWPKHTAGKITFHIGGPRQHVLGLWQQAAPGAVQT